MSLERIPPTRAALVPLVKWTHLVSAFIWGKCLNLLSPKEYGWDWNDQLQI